MRVFFLLTTILSFQVDEDEQNAAVEGLLLRLNCTYSSQTLVAGDDFGRDAMVGGGPNLASVCIHFLPA
jgi:hypothetical protein